VKIPETKPQTLGEITPIVKRVRSKEINQYLNKKYREVSFNLIFTTVSSILNTIVGGITND